MAYRLQNSTCMNAECIGWRRLTPDAIADLPEESAVFEVANLVRNVQYIGVAQGNLRTRLGGLTREQTKLPVMPGGYYFRYETTAQEDEALSSRLTAYRDGHAGSLPLGNRESLPAPLRLASRQAA